MSEFFNWQKDPLLLDLTPTPMNMWQTANKILSLEKQENNHFVNLNNLLLNLYSILVRKIDFVRVQDSDRILSRFPFIVLTEEEKELIRSKILLIADFSRKYFFKAITSNLSIWQTRFLTYLERGALPYPLYRCACEVLQRPVSNHKKDTQLFESARGKQYTIPTKITPIIAYLCGVINGDGHLHSHWLRVVDETKAHIRLISQLFEKIFSDSGEIFQTGNAWNVELRSSSAVRLFNFLTDQTIEGAKYESLQEPLLFKQLGEPFRSLYWRGVFDADGSFKHHISFGSASETFVTDFDIYLHSVNIKSKKGTIGDSAYSLTIPALYRLNFINHIGVDNPKKKKDMLTLFKKISCQFKGLNQTNLIEGLYFNLFKISSLSILGLGSYLTKVRGKTSIETRSKELGIATNLYAEYEKGLRSITLKTIQTILQLSEKDLHVLLTTQPNLLYQSSTSERVKLPVLITSKIIELMSLLEPTKTYVKLLLDESPIVSEVEQLFGLPIKLGRINSRVVLNFCNQFGVYSKPSVHDIKFQSIFDL